MNRTKKLYAVGAFFSALGLISSFWQLLDKLTLLKNPGSSLSCNLNDVFSCGRVLSSHQYEVFGFPNAIIALVMFSFFLTVFIVGVSGGRLVRKFMLIVQGLALFMLGFILWFVFESVYRIGAMCLFCTIIGPSVVVLNAVLLRLNWADHPRFKKLVFSGADIFGWALLMLVVGLLAVLKFSA